MEANVIMIPRPDYLDAVIPFLDKPLVKVLTGMRRVGKSTIMKLLEDHLITSGIAEDHILYINMELLAWDSIRDYADLYRYVKKALGPLDGRRYLLVDEIQDVDQWERAVNSIRAEGLADIIISGSNARLLSSELATLLTGRYIEFPVYPLSFREFLQFRGNAALDRRDEFSTYLRYGGMPGIHDLELVDDQVFPFMNALYSSIILKDVIHRNRIQDPALLDRLNRFIFDNCGNITSAKSISDFLKSQRLKLGVDKVMTYLHYLEQAYIIHKVPRYDLKGRRLLELYEKYYASDVGLRHGLLGYRDQDISGLLENIIYLELLRRGFSITIGKLNDLEVDFIAQKAGKRYYVQVTLSLNSSEVIEREFAVLEKISDSFPKVIISLDDYQRTQRSGIHHLNMIDYLLMKTPPEILS